MNNDVLDRKRQELLTAGSHELLSLLQLRKRDDRRLRRAGAGDGDIQVSLMWHARDRARP